MERIDDLTLELTRKCNLKCNHCLRGCAQNKTMSLQVMCQIFDRKVHIDRLSIGGGETGLALEAMENLLYAIAYGRATVGNIFLVTNGKNERLTLELFRLYLRIYELCDDNEVSQFAFSNDQYHCTERNGERISLKMFKWVVYRKMEESPCEWASADLDSILVEHTTAERDMPILARGRAKNWGDKKEPYLDCIRLDSIENPAVVTGQMYVCYDGSVVGDANMAYGDMKPYLRGNVMNWLDMVEQLKASTMENYHHCKAHCSCFEGCGEYSEELREELKK